jgi:hypothetical protein
LRTRNNVACAPLACRKSSVLATCHRSSYGFPKKKRVRRETECGATAFHPPATVFRDAGEYL